MIFSKPGDRRYLLLVLLLLGVCILDSLIPLGYPVWTSYIIPIILASRGFPPRVLTLTVIASIGLIVLGYLLSPTSVAPLDMVIFGRVMGIAVILTMAKLLKDNMKREEELMLGEERFRLSIEQVEDYAIILLDARGHVRNWNSGAERLKQFRADEVVGKPMSCFYTPEDQAIDVPDQLLRRAQEDGRVEHEGLRIRKDGSRFMADVILVSLRDKTGSLKGFAKVTRDITKRREAEEIVQKQEIMKRVYEERESIARNLHDGVLQSLYAVRLGLESCRRMLVTHPQDARSEMDARIEDVGLVITEVRDFMTGQDPAWVRTKDLQKGLEELLSLSQVENLPLLRLHVPESGGVTDLSSDEIKHLMYIAREAISNTVRHASAKCCDVTLVFAEDCLRLTIEDDGVGFSMSTAYGTGRGFGNMEARARQIGGTLDIVSSPGGGARITIEMTRRNTHVSS